VLQAVASVLTEGPGLSGSMMGFALARQIARGVQDPAALRCCTSSNQFKLSFVKFTVILNNRQKDTR